MHKNSLVKFTSILFTFISILQISYTYVVSKIEKDDYALLDMSDKCASFSEFYDIILKQKNEFDS